MNAHATMSESELLDVLADGRASEESRARCERVVEKLRRRTTRNVLPAVLSFGSAVCIAVVAYSLVWMDGDLGGTTILGVGFLLCIALVSIRSGIRDLSIDPRDELLLLLAEDYLKRNAKPNKVAPSTE